MRPFLQHPLLPTLVTALILILGLSVVIAEAGGDPLALARLGTRFSDLDPAGTEGYDGQFVYYIARDPRPAAVAPHLDNPAYRYQRILLPLLARLAAVGDPARLPWALAALGVLTHTLGTWAVSALLARRGVSRWYALSYALFPGFTLAVRLDLPEPLAFGLVALALLAAERGRRGLGWGLLGLALFAKETVAPFLLAYFLAEWVAGRRREALLGALAAGLPFLLFQGWLWGVFGQPGLGSGGAMATPFEIVPYLGLLRIAAYLPWYFVGMLLVFGPAVVLPSLWGTWHSARAWLRGERNVIVLGVFLNAALLAFLPFSTYREPGGLLRFACGLALALLVYGAEYRLRRVLNYSPFWIVLNVFLIA
jgi:hypothetical protein